MKRAIAICVTVLAALPAAQAQVAADHSPKPVVMHSTPNAQAAETPVARVNGAVLTDRDLLREMYSIFPYARQHNGRFPKEMEAGIRNGAMQMIIFEELVYQEALRRRMAVGPLKLQKAEVEFRNQFATPDQYQEFVHAEFNGSQQLVKERIRRSLLIDALLESEVAAKSRISTAEAKAYYEKNPAAFQYPESFAFQTISVLPPEKPAPNQSNEDRKRAEAALRQAKATKTYEEFGILAEKISDDDYRVMMGDHRSVDRAKLAPNVVQALLKMQPGQVSDIIQVDQAYTIVRLNKHVLAGKVGFAAIQDKLKEKLQAQKSEALRAALNRELRRKAKVEIL